MPVLLGIDVGTSSVKALLLDGETGKTLSTAGREIPLHTPRPGWVEQDPADWWQATEIAVQKAFSTAAISPDAVIGIGLSGQMHGTVLLDGDHQPVRPVIIWADSRTAKEASDLNRQRAEHPNVVTPGPAVTGFMGPTLKWLAEHEPAVLEHTQAAILPKDYVRLRLTGEIATDRTDAASTWLLDIASDEWSPELCAWCGVEMGLLPPLLDPAEVAGVLTPSAANALGLPPGVPVVSGAADQAAQALGHGILHPGKALVTIGTGGQVFLPLAAPTVDAAGRMHTFIHAAPDRWYGLAAILAAGLSLRWLRDTLGTTYEELSARAAEVSPGAEGLLFLPYLAGERTPHMDSAASGAFVGLRLGHGPEHLARAVMEGVALALAHCLEIAESLGEQAETVIASGGAMISPAWRQILADALDRPLLLAEGKNQAAVGAALLAGVGSGLYASIDKATAVLPAGTRTVEPDPSTAAFYAERREVYGGLYDHLRDDMHRLIPPTY